MIAVTGANGLLGSFIVRKLLERGEPFVALKRSPSEVSLLRDVHDKIHWRDADVLDPVSLDEALKNVTHVIHAAAMVSFNPRAASKLYNVNVQGTRNVINASLANGVKRFVHISSVAALGRLKGQRLVTEDQKWTDNPLNSTYAESKYLAELEVFRGQEEGLNTVTLNPSVILAPADWNKSSAKIFKYVWDQNPFYIDNHLNYVDVRDVAELAWQLLNSPVHGERFIINSGSVRLIDLLTQTAARFNKRPPAFKLNRVLLKFVAVAENVRSTIMGSEPLLTTETARMAGTEFFYSNEKIKTLLGFKFQTIDETLDWCCKYYLAQIQPKK
jgi:dihydroflavonol-4-reductase